MKKKNTNNPKITKNFNRFLDSLRSLNSVIRWAPYTRLKNENVAEHSYWVSFYAMLLSDIEEKIFGNDIDIEKVLRAAVIHDWEEAITGDIISPVKRYSDDMEKACRQVTDAFFNEVVSYLPDERLSKLYQKSNEVLEEDSPEGQILKIAEAFSCLFYIMDEFRLGNPQLIVGFRWAIRKIKNSKLKSALYIFKHLEKECNEHLKEAAKKNFTVFDRDKNNYRI